MNFYQIIITSIIYTIIIIIIEGLLLFSILSTILDNVLGNVINNSAGLSLNTLMQDNYNNITSNLNIDAANIKNGTFISLATKLYLIGTFSNEITNEEQYIDNNNLKSYIYYTVFLGIIFFLFVIIKGINYIIFNNKYSVNWKTVILNIGISLLLLIIFMTPIIFIVFINIQENININLLELKILNIFQKLFAN